MKSIHNISEVDVYNRYEILLASDNKFNKELLLVTNIYVSGITNYYRVRHNGISIAVHSQLSDIIKDYNNI